MLYYHCYRSLHITDSLADRLANSALSLGGWFTVNASGLYLYVPSAQVFWLHLLDSDLDRVASLDYVQ